ncbi:winged helix-turn-helix domain-containing protein [Bowmanella denitrificans]|uniref:winged helix-turn-helix domain-containing protein n=1 Tax=Bowmanella denitrificans TaxID=366582 RepID=UPI0031D4ABC7
MRNSFQLGNCRVVPSECAVYFNNGEKQNLQPKLIEVLIYLADAYPAVVSRQELIDKVWQGNTYVGENALNNVIWNLRQIFKEGMQDEVIETLRKTGYRLLIAPDSLSSPSSSAEHTSRPSARRLWPWLAAAVLVILFISSFGLLNHSQQTSQRSIQALTTEPGLELFPSPSADGRYLVYKWVSADGQVDLFKRDLLQPGLAAVRLTYDQASEGHSVWSHDSRFLYFSRKDRSKAQCDIVRMDMQNYEEVFVTHCPIGGGYYYIDISPDDKILAFYGSDPDAEQSGVYFLDLQDKNASPVRFSCARHCGYKDRDMAFSPDGKHLVLTRRVNEFNENIYLVTLSDQSTRQLTQGEEDIVGLTWHPDGQRLVYAVQRADVRSGFMLDLRTGRQYPLEIEGLSYPSFARNQPWLFFQHRSEQYQIASVQVDAQISSAPYPVLQSVYNHKYPDYSATTNQLAFISNETGHYEVWVSDAFGNNRRQLTHLKRNSRYPTWSHNGQRIAFLATDDDGKGDRIYQVDVATKRISALDSPFEGHNRPTWTLDDQGIVSAVFNQDHTDIYLFRQDGSVPQRLTFNGGEYGIMQDNDKLIYSVQRKGLWQTDIHSGQTRQLLEEQHFRNPYSWTLSEQGVYFMQANNQHQQLRHYDLANGQNLVLLQIPSASVESDSPLTYDANHARLLFTETEFPQSDIKMLKDPLFQ